MADYLSELLPHAGNRRRSRRDPRIGDQRGSWPAEVRRFRGHQPHPKEEGIRQSKKSKSRTKTSSAKRELTAPRPKERRWRNPPRQRARRARTVAAARGESAQARVGAAVRNGSSSSRSSSNGSRAKGASASRSRPRAQSRSAQSRNGAGSITDTAIDKATTQVVRSPMRHPRQRPAHRWWHCARRSRRGRGDRTRLGAGSGKAGPLKRLGGSKPMAKLAGQARPRPVKSFASQMKAYGQQAPTSRTRSRRREKRTELRVSRVPRTIAQGCERRAEEPPRPAHEGSPRGSRTQRAMAPLHRRLQGRRASRPGAQAVRGAEASVPLAGPSGLPPKLSRKSHRRARTPRAS